MIGWGPTVIAWKMLVHERNRLLFSIMGISFSILILFMESGFFLGLNDSESNLGTVFDADLVIFHRVSDNLKASYGNRLKTAEMLQVMGFDEVENVSSIYISQQLFRNPKEKFRYKESCISVDINKNSLLVPEIQKYKNKLAIPGNILFDRLSRRELGEVNIGDAVRLGSERVKVVGFFELGANFSSDANIIMSHESYSQLFGSGPIHGFSSLGLVKLLPGFSAQVVRSGFKKRMQPHVDVLTTDELVLREKIFTTRRTPSGMVLGIGFVVGVAIGIIICYQILFNLIHDHMPQFATLKAIGFTSGKLKNIVLSKAVLLSLISFLPGFLLSLCLYQLIEHYTQIVIHVTFFRVVGIFLVTLLMCFFAGILAIKKVVKADPASLF